jgi:hypothetical protein
VTELISALSGLQPIMLNLSEHWDALWKIALSGSGLSLLLWVLRRVKSGSSSAIEKGPGLYQRWVNWKDVHYRLAQCEGRAKESMRRETEAARSLTVLNGTLDFYVAQIVAMQRRGELPILETAPIPDPDQTSSPK